MDKRMNVRWVRWKDVLNISIFDSESTDGHVLITNAKTILMTRAMAAIISSTFILNHPLQWMEI